MVVKLTINIENLSFRQEKARSEREREREIRASVKSPYILYL